MGRRKAGFRKPKQANNAQVQGPRKPYQDIIRENEKFIQYYKTQGICKVEEWDTFISALKSDLPATFRITGSKGEAKKMLDIIKDIFVKNCLNEPSENGEKKPDIFPLPWYPDNLAWQMELTRKDIRRNESYYKLHNFLISETEHGTISRQETVSMIPPLVLDVKPHHKVLDMCAAPGSKTAQLLELLHASDVSIPSGYVIANDVDNKRCYMLVHQAKRLNSPCVAVVNHDSAILPNFSCTLPDGSTDQVQFDRILCDVPCSGDGTMRKNPDIWMKWTPANGVNLHGIQSRIIRRGVELLAIGGRLVYSTCSLNPIENEAVIHRLLAETDDSLKLVDVGDSLPGLKYSPGMENWQVGTRNLDFYNSFEEVDEKWRTTIRPQMFPPKEEDKSKYNLNKCIRILPHQQNTGAFFVAVLEKLKPINVKEKSFKITPQSEENNPDEDTTTSDNDKLKNKRLNEDRLPENQRKRRRKEGYKEDPYVFFNETETVWPSIQKFYDISNDFDVKCLLVRCNAGKRKNIYLTSPAIRDLVLQNQGSIKFINTGVKTFVRCDNRNMKECAFRIANDGLESVFDYIGHNRKISIPRDDLITLLMNTNPEEAPQITSLSEEIQAQVNDLPPGSCILIYKEENPGKETLILHVSGWRGTTSLRSYMSQHSTVHYLRLLGGDVSKYDVNKFKKLEEEGDNEAKVNEENKEEEKVEEKSG
ncbi:tRNA (cytosine(34)-C(5))-methyltransferase [Onthophagus taurus]|uniref:tRNA (cytosine(34)-C(5))-methyltransferase n=1 Tax=Onthophagus taurus TaxID=166361 RepID=UPI0039BE9FC1